MALTRTGRGSPRLLRPGHGRPAPRRRRSAAEAVFPPLALLARDQPGESLLALWLRSGGARSVSLLAAASRDGRRAEASPAEGREVASELHVANAQGRAGACLLV